MYRGLVRLIGMLLRGLLMLVVRLLPFVFRLLGLTLALIATSLTSLFVGVPTAVDRISDGWIDDANKAGIPVEQHPNLRSGARVGATVTLILGWLVILFLIVLLLRAWFS